MGFKMVRFDDLLSEDGAKVTSYTACPGYEKDRSSLMQSYRPVVVRLVSVNHEVCDFPSLLFYLIIESVTSLICQTDWTINVNGFNPNVSI